MAIDNITSNCEERPGTNRKVLHNISGPKPLNHDDLTKSVGFANK